MRNKFACLFADMKYASQMEELGNHTQYEFICCVQDVNESCCVFTGGDSE